MPTRAESIGVSRVGTRRRRRREMTFPTALVDFRLVAAGFDKALAWLSRFRVLNSLTTRVARWTRRLVVHVHQIRGQLFASQTTNEYTVWSVWVSNGGGEDAPDVRFQTRWTTDSDLLNVETDRGLWLGAETPPTGQTADASRETVDLNSQGVMRYLGIAVKYTGDDHAYVVSPETLHRFSEDTTWRWPSQAIGPGLHLVDIALRSADGAAALVRLKIMNPGRDAPLKVFLRTGQLVS